MKPDQLPLDLPPLTAMQRADFLASPCNATALAAVETSTDWPMPRMLIAGPRGSGRTHLAHIFAELTGGQFLRHFELVGSDFNDLGPAIAVDDADLLAGDAAGEEALFHLHNATQSRSVPLLILGRDLPGVWGVTLPDLASRLASYPVTQLAPPDDALLTMVLGKLFDDRQLYPDPEVLLYLVQRMERSLDRARQLVAALDRAALAKRRSVTKNLARSVLAELSTNAT